MVRASGSPRLLSLALILLALVGVVVLWRTTQSPGPAGPAGSNGGAQPLAFGDLGPAPTAPTTFGGRLALPERAERASVEPALQNFDLADAVWLEGRVELPPHARAEPDLGVVAVAGRPADRLVERADVSQLLELLASGSRALWVARRPLAADGSFRVPLPAAPPGSLVASLRLDGCYLALVPPLGSCRRPRSAWSSRPPREPG